MATGTVARVTDRGFGFITPDEGGGKDIFFHANELKNVHFNDLREGDKVSFEISQSDKGPNAVEVNRM